MLGIEMFATALDAKRDFAGDFRPVALLADGRGLIAGGRALDARQSRDVLPRPRATWAARPATL
ncbi:MAG: hypothetical protein IPO20_16475 [Gammaproteobacteria bacterium]|nr:hypothetical protein [Gammaproteobacteria bacterium]